MIMLTDNAASKVNELISVEGEDGLALRVAVRPGGCSGFSYETVSYTHLTLPTKRIV